MCRRKHHLQNFIAAILKDVLRYDMSFLLGVYKMPDYWVANEQGKLFSYMRSL